MVYFEEKGHKYFSEKNEKYISVSALYGKYKPQFDKEFWSNHHTLKVLMPDFAKYKKQLGEKRAVSSFTKDWMNSNPDLFLKEKNKILEQWATKNLNSVTKGNLFHKDAEKMAYIRKVIENPFTKTAARVIEIPKGEYGNQSAKSSLYELEDGYYPELLLWNDEYKIAGQSDKVFITTIDSVRYVDIDDYKTNEKIDTKGFRGEKMLAPLQNLENCNYNHYSLAISLYAYMMEDFGFKVRNLGFHHHNVLYNIEYLKSDIDKILLRRKESLLYESQ